MTDKTQENFTESTQKLNRRQFSLRTLMGLMGVTTVATPYAYKTAESWIDNKQLILNDRLDEAIGQQDTVAARQLLKEERADVNFMPPEKNHPLLSKAAWYGNPKMIQLLVDYGAITSAVDEHLRTALHCAIDHVVATDIDTDTNIKLVDTLLTVMKPDELNIQNTTGETALSALIHRSLSQATECRRLGTTSDARLLSRLQGCVNIVNLMIHKGCETNETDKMNITTINALISEYEEHDRTTPTHSISKPKLMPSQVAESAIPLP